MQTVDLPPSCRRIVSLLAEKGVAFKVVDDPTIDTTSRTGKLVMGILALIAEFENDIRRERQMDGIAKAKERGVQFGRKPILVAETVRQVKKLRKAGKTVPEIMRKTSLSKASVYRALSAYSPRPLRVVKRTFLASRSMSAKCQKQTSAANPRSCSSIRSLPEAERRHNRRPGGRELG